MCEAYLELLCQGLPEELDGALALGEEHLGEVLAPLGQLGAPSQQRYARVLLVTLGFFLLFIRPAVRSRVLPSLYRRWSVVCGTWASINVVRRRGACNVQVWAAAYIRALGVWAERGS